MPIKEVESWSEAVQASQTGNLYTKKEKYPVVNPKPGRLNAYLILTDPEKGLYDQLNDVHYFKIHLPNSEY